MRERDLERVDQQRRLSLMLDLLRDAGADDLVRSLTADQAALLYHEVVHAVQRAAAEWRSARAARQEALTHDDDHMTRLDLDDHFGPGREP